MRILNIAVKDLDPVLYKKLHNLNFRREGLMQSTLSSTRNSSFYHGYAHIYKPRNTVLGWALSYYTNNQNLISTYIYVRRTHRRQGIGSTLLDAAKSYIRKNQATMCVYPFDDLSTAFYRGRNFDERNNGAWLQSF